MELATLAAMVAPGAQPRAALIRAVVLYGEAVKFARELPPTYDELVGNFGGSGFMDGLTNKVQAAIDAYNQDTLRLDPASDDDDARQFLATHGVTLKLGKSVMANLLQYLESRPRNPDPLHVGTPPPADEIIASWASTDGVYNVPKWVLEKMVIFMKARARAARLKGVATKALQNAVKKNLSARTAAKLRH
jgi:hypothetical protein